jgi:hypothetical protein
MSAHIPLERLAAAFLGGLLHLASVCPQPEAYHAAIRRTLGADERRPAQERQAAVRRWEMCGMAAQRVLSWMSQVSGGGVCRRWYELETSACCARGTKSTACS